MLNIISLGAGVQSSTMALMAAYGEIEPMPDCAIFADTGAEPAHVYEWLDWLESMLPFPVHRAAGGNIRDDIIASTKGGSERKAPPPFFTGSVDQKGMLRRQCTVDYKINPIHKVARELAGLKPRQRVTEPLVNMWIGISTDEIQRMKGPRGKWLEHRWPLIEMRLTRGHCLEWFKRHNMPAPPKSACTFCPYTDNARWREMKENDPESWADAVAVDEIIRNGVRNTTEKLYVHPQMVPLAEADLRGPAEYGQLSMLDECDGMCGV